MSWFVELARFVIYIKAGAYFENVEVDRKKTMLMFVGDGIGKTVVKASRNVVDGFTTFRSATVGKFHIIFIFHFFLHYNASLTSGRILTDLDLLTYWTRDPVQSEVTAILTCHSIFFSPHIFK